MDVQVILDDAKAVGDANSSLPGLRQAQADAHTALTQAQTTSAAAIKTVSDQQNSLVNSAMQAAAIADANLSAALQAEKTAVDKLVADATEFEKEEDASSAPGADATS